jgi:hypothetical protein
MSIAITIKRLRNVTDSSAGERNMIRVSLFVAKLANIKSIVNTIGFM